MLATLEFQPCMLPTATNIHQHISPSDSSSLQQKWQSNGSSYLHRPVPRGTAKRTAPRRMLTSSGPTPLAPLAGCTRAPTQRGGSAPRREHGVGRIRTEGGGSGGTGRWIGARGERAVRMQGPTCLSAQGDR